MSDVPLSVVSPPPADDVSVDVADVIAASIPAAEPPAQAAEAEPGRATGPSYAAPAPDQREAVVETVRTAREVPPGLRERLSVLVQQAPTLDVTGEADFFNSPRVLNTGLFLIVPIAFYLLGSIVVQLAD